VAPTGYFTGICQITCSASNIIAASFRGGHRIPLLREDPVDDVCYSGNSNRTIRHKIERSLSQILRLYDFAQGMRNSRRRMSIFAFWPAPETFPTSKSNSACSAYAARCTGDDGYLSIELHAALAAASETDFLNLRLSTPAYGALFKDAGSMKTHSR
jgi:hypothetical protein